MSNQVVDFMPAGPVARAFMESKAFVRGIMGPIGSGKSVCCAVEILRKAQQQAPGLDGVRRTRWAVIRNSYPELRTTTLATWLQWCPAAYGKVTYDSPIVHRIRTAELDIEVLFLALDREEDQRKLLSLEVTGAWVNEARTVPKAIIDALTGRVGRFPSMSMGGPTWSGILLDTNAPDDQSWYYKAAEEGTPEGWEFFKQPSGESPEAENIQNLVPGYYKRTRAGKDSDWTKVYIEGQYGFVVEGRPVFPMFRDRTHIAAEPIAAVMGLPLQIGVDFGLDCTATMGQKLVDGRWLILDELTTSDTGVVRFAEMLTGFVSRRYPSHEVAAVWCDPAGGQRAQTDESTPIGVLGQHTGWRVRPAPSNDLTMRLEVVKAALNRMVDGNAGLSISPTCSVLRKAMNGGYCFKLVKSGNGSQTHETPDKNAFSHVSDALQYLLAGGGEYRVVMNRVAREAGAGARQARDLDYDLTGDRETPPTSRRDAEIARRALSFKY